ncbi:ankyrin repeat-containing domain protein [Apiospora saccharicola]|uniref:Ankyrin repeat-containing domain protein n=1 Tax=Apiospora saccharicola TaxID=335842 RepID=A0ABR1WKE7_9PEZI
MARFLPIHIRVFTPSRAFPLGRPPRLNPAIAVVSTKIVRSFSATPYTTHAEVDHEGGTVFHEAARSGYSVKRLEEIAGAGVDVNRPNSTGRLPLHVLFRVGFWDLDAPDYREEMQWIIQHTKNVDASDNEGIRPLHLSSSLSEFLVRDLLAAGADPVGTTFEGLTPLHLAAYARESNIVGMLLETTVSSANGWIMLACQHHLDAKDELGRKPLHYACRSGRPETVSLLLTAGADPTVEDDQGRTPLEACAEFEDEQALLAGWRKPTWCECHEFCLPERLANIESPQETTRVEEIIGVLHDTCAMRRAVEGGHGPVEERCPFCFQHCKPKNPAYTACESLLQQSPSTDDKKIRPPFPSDDEVMERLDRRVSEVVDRVKEYTKPGNPIGLKVFEHLLLKQEYHAIQWLLRQGGPSLPILEETNIPKFAQLLETMLDSPFYGPKIFETCSHAQQEPEFGRAGDSADPILLVAARRELPNMEIMRLLVEKTDAKGRGMNLNAKGRTGQAFFDKEIDYPGMYWSDDDIVEPGKNTALHEFAKGRHWWHVAQGIPYLLAMGAHTSQRNEAKQTPLEMAKAMLQPHGGEQTFTRRAVDILRGASWRTIGLGKASP